MKHFPHPDRGPARIDGITVTSSPWHASRLTRVLAAVVLFVAGFFTGAIAFGSALVHSANTYAEGQPSVGPAKEGSAQ